MTSRPCDQIDDYLCGWLPPEEATVYEAHLADCAACREECATQRRIDQLLATETVTTVPIPIGLRSQVHGRIRAAYRRRLLYCAGAAAAASMVALALVLFATKNIVFTPREERQTAQHSSAGHDVSPSVAPPTSAEPPIVVARVTMIDPSSAIVVPLDSQHPNVTLVQVLPTISASPEDDVPSSPGAQDIEKPDIE